jgi:hypothetical protein
MLLTFDGQLQAAESIVPLTGDAIETAARFLDLPGLDLPQALASHAEVANEAGTGEDVQVLGDRLPRDVGTVGEPSDGEWPACAQAGHQIEPGFVAEGREDQRRVT